MPGRKGRSGRRPGSLSWWRNPTALAGHRLNVLIEQWLAGMPIQTGPDSWLVQPTERRHTVPPKIKRALAAMAIQHVMMNDCEVDRNRVLAVDVADVLEWVRRRAPSVTLRRAARSEPRDEVEKAHREMVERMETAWKK